MKANLIRVAFSNCFSIKDKQEIFFTAESKYSSDKDKSSWNLIGNKETLGDLIVPVTVFYGANASGKTNALIGIRRLNSLFNRYKSKPSHIRRATFALSTSEPSILEYDFYLDRKIYSIRIAYDNDKIIKEDLVRYDKQKEKLIYSRDSKQYDKSYVSELAQNEINEVIKTRKDVLILELLTLRAIPPFKDIYQFFEEFNPEQVRPDEIAKKLYFNPKLKNKIENYLKFADFGISKIIVDRKQIQQDVLKLNEKLVALIGEYMGSDVSQFVPHEKFLEDNQYDYFMKFEHSCYTRNFEVNDKYESDGTKLFLNLLIKFLPAFIEGGVFLIDELEESLHPMLLTEIIKLFHNPKINISGAQLIFSTHDTSLLKSELLRRDEIWFVEKNQNGESIIYPLSDFTDVRNNYNYEKGYLDGRFGAIPYLGNIKSLIDLCKE